MKSMKKALFVVGSFVPALAFAAFPEGQYTATFYHEEPGSGSGSQGICLVGSGSTGTWYSDTFSAWSGKWYRKGNDIHLHGNYAAGVGNDAFELTRVNNQLLTGYWQEWRDDGSHDSYLTIKFTHRSDTCNPPARVGASGSGNPSQ